MWELDHKESWVPKNWCFQTVVLEKTLKSPLDCKEIQPVHSKGNQLWIFIGRIDAETEAPTLWPLDGKNWHIGKHLDSGKDWRQEEKGITEDEMVGWHHRLDEHESEQALGVWWWVAKPGVLQSTFRIPDAIQDATLHLLTCVSSDLCQFLILPLFIMITIVLNSTGQVFWRMFHVLFVCHRSQCNRKSPKGNPNTHWKILL